MAIVEVGALRAMLSMDAGQFIRGSKRAATSLERTLGRVSKAATKIGQSLSLYVSAPLVAAGAASYKIASDFSKNMSNISTLVDTSKVSMARMSKEVIALGRKTPVPLNELSGALYGIYSAGFKADEAMNTLKGSAQLAVAGLGTTAQAADLVAGTINSFGLEGKEAARVYDVVFKTVKNGITTISKLSQGFGAVAGTVAANNIAFDEYFASVSALTSTTLPAAVAHTQLRAIIAGLTRETKESKAIFDAYGVKTFPELIKKAGGFVNALKLVSASVGGSQAALLKLVGSTEALNAVIGLTGNQNKAFTDTLNDMRNGAELVTGAFNKQNKEVWAVQQRMKNAIDQIAIAIGTILTPMIEKIATWVNSLADAFSKLDPYMQQFIVAGGAIAIVLGPILLVVGKLVKALKWIAPVLRTVGSAILAVTSGPMAALLAVTGAVTAAWVYFSDTLNPIVNAIGSAIANTFSTIVDWIRSAYNWVLRLIGILPSVGNAAEQAAIKLNVAAQAARDLRQASMDLRAQGEDPHNVARETKGERQTTSTEGATGWFKALAAVDFEKLNEVITPVKVNLDNLKTAHQGATEAAKQHKQALQEAAQIMQELQTPAEKLAQKQQKINELFRKGALTVEQYGRAMAAASAMNSKNIDALASTVSSNLSTIFGDTKAVAIATALINTYQGITKALATYPPPISYAMAAVQAAAGFAQVANIRKQTSKSGGGGGSASTAQQSTAAAAVPQQSQTLTVHGIQPNALFTGNTVRAFAEKLRDYQADGGKVVFAS